jgi:hypothetical protein
MCIQKRWQAAVDGSCFLDAVLKGKCCTATTEIGSLHEKSHDISPVFVLQVHYLLCIDYSAANKT